jgi:hypothetical protein
MLNDREMESCSIVASALELNTFGPRRRSMCDYKLLEEDKRERKKLIEIHGRVGALSSHSPVQNFGSSLKSPQ